MVCNLTSTSGNGTLNSSDDKGVLETYNYGRHEYCDDFRVEHILMTYVGPTLFVLIIIIGIIGNSMVVTVVAYNPQMRSITNLLITNLAVADLLFTMFYVPFKAYDFAVPHWHFGVVPCKVIYYLLIVCNYATIYTLLLMTTDRFLAIVYPVRSLPYRTKRNAFWAIGGMWTVVLLSITPAIQSHGVIFHKSGGKEYSECVFLPAPYRLDIAMIAFLITAYIVPLSCILCMYTKIVQTLWSDKPRGSLAAENLLAKKRGTRMVIVTVLVFAICWGPLVFVMLLKGLGKFKPSVAKISIEVTAYTMAYANSCTNPFLYAFLSKSFRKGFKNAIHCTPRFKRYSNS